MVVAGARPHQEGIARIVVQRVRPGVGYQRLKTLQHLAAILHLKAMVFGNAVIRGQREQCRRSVARTTHFAPEQAASGGTDVADGEQRRGSPAPDRE